MAVSFAAFLNGCGGSSLKSSKRDAGQGGQGGSDDSGQGSGGANATGGRLASGGAAGQGSGGEKATGGVPGSGGLPGKGGAAGIGAGGLPGKGGIGAGGVTSAGGKPGTGGMGSGGRTGGTGGTGNGGTSGTAAALLQPLGNVFCAAAKSCCGRESYPAAALADCESKFLSRLQFTPAVDKGTIAVDEKVLATCVEAYKTAATTCTITPFYTACKGIFVGTKPENQPCGSGNQMGSLECKTTGGAVACLWSNSSTDPSVTGRCVAIPHGKEGDECSTSCAKNESCISDIFGGDTPSVSCFEEDGLYCAWSKKPVVCRPIRKIDQACTSDMNACGSGNFCDWTTNTCQAIKKLGESCEDASCASELMCGTSLKCVEQAFASEFTCKGESPYIYF